MSAAANLNVSLMDRTQLPREWKVHPWRVGGCNGGQRVAVASSELPPPPVFFFFYYFFFLPVSWQTSQ